MDKIDFVHLAWAVIDVHHKKAEEPGSEEFSYDDDYINIECDNPQHAIEITRKAINNIDSLHLRVENPVTYVTKGDGPDNPPEIIRHHGEHTYIVPHMLYLIERSEKYREFFSEMLTKYPETNVHYGI